VHAAGWLSRRSEHDRPQAGRVPRRPRLRRRARTAVRQSPRPGALARTRSYGGCQPGCGRQPGAGPDDPGPGRPPPAELAAFFGCLYYAALRPEEAVALCREDLIFPAHGHGTIILTAACPRIGTAWTSTGIPHEPRGLKHRPDGAIRVVPIPSVLARMLRQQRRQFGTTPDGRLFRGTRGGILSESVYGRVWHAARLAALGPELAVTALARRPYDLRHAALSLWLNATNAPAEVAARAGNSTRVLHDTYLHCIDSHQDLVSQRTEDALGADLGGQPP